MDHINSFGPSPLEVDSSSKSPAKNRSLSDPPTALAPSPSIREKLRRESKDDNAVPSTPKGTRRPDFLSRGLSLQMPSPTQLSRTGPLSPRLEQTNIHSYMQSQSQTGSPATSLPRHSRGLDFSRASTNLHHSTLAEQREPDSSPVGAHRAMNIPGRKMSMGSMALESPAFLGGGTWGSLAPERSTVSSSVGSVNMLASESESSDSDEDASMAGDEDDPIFATPQVHKLQNPTASTPFSGPLTPGGSTWTSGSAFSPAAQSLMKTIRRSRLHSKGTNKSRKHSSSASNSGYSSMASPRAHSPPPMRSIESAGGGYFGMNKATRSRRESLALGTDGLHLSSGNDSGDEGSGAAPGTPGVIRRAVTRRGNLLPKTKGFARVRAALTEESQPVDTEIRRESETIRQVREREPRVAPDLDPTRHRPQTATAASSPNLLPAVPEAAQEDFGRDLEQDISNNDRGLGMNFALHAHRNSAGTGYWNRFDPSMRTPPPPNFNRQGSSIMSDINMDSPLPSEAGFSMKMRGRAQSSASDASDAFGPTVSNNSTAAASGLTDDMHLNKFKRRRDDDYDIAYVKRRAVSPGMSTQNSPVLTQSPSYRDSNGSWGQPPEKKKDSQSQSANSDTSQSSHQAGSSRAGSGSLPAGKKLGLQGMVDTNNELMKMSIG